MGVCVWVEGLRVQQVSCDKQGRGVSRQLSSGESSFQKLLCFFELRVT